MAPRRSLAIRIVRASPFVLGALTLAGCGPGPDIVTASATLSPSPATATATPSLTPTSTPSIPTTRQVGLRADQVIMPLNELPLAGYKVSGDSGHPLHWRRTFDPLARIGAEYGYIDVAVTITVTPARARAYL